MNQKSLLQISGQSDHRRSEIGRLMKSGQWRKKKINFFLLFTIQISSNGRSGFVCGPIDLKFEGEIFNSLISNLNGGDRIWSSERLLFQSVNSASLLLNFFSPGQFWSSALIEINPWSDRDYFWLARSQLIDLHFERWKLDLEFGTVVICVREQ